MYLVGFKQFLIYSQIIEYSINGFGCGCLMVQGGDDKNSNACLKAFQTGIVCFTRVF
ncbi:phosphate acetyltransferase [Neisseria wadsworthii 9715]|uniref:Phosphate acetyltransferase n=1 Tax=Neisseria wadsworthii 9715 TaxID=1030841 RepID=G4CP44_9NEIS|nr:phosphate acetyltransferase [Neisseria wadsworthii 9715]